LTFSLFKRMPGYLAIAKGLKPFGVNREWSSPYVELSKDVSEFEDTAFSSEESFCSNDFSELEFEDIIGLSKKLKEKDKQLLRDMFIEGLNMSDVARKNKCSREFVRQRKGKVLDNLRRALSFDDIKSRKNKGG